VDLVTVTTCHRDWSDQDRPVQHGGIFTPKRDFKFQFELAKGIEDWGTCLLRVNAFNKAGQPQQMALLDFETKDSTLPAKIYCDGDSYQAGGVSICQSKAGLDEEIVFDAPVWLSDKTKPECHPHTPKDGTHWIYHLPQSECVVYFIEQTPPHRIHRHTFSGYKNIQLNSQ
jgi:hypothetical protein